MLIVYCPDESADRPMTCALDFVGKVTKMKTADNFVAIVKKQKKSPLVSGKFLRTAAPQRDYALDY
jgi:hypothetical protein